MPAQIRIQGPQSDGEAIDDEDTNATPLSPERTFLCQDRPYPFARSRRNRAAVIYRGIPTPKTGSVHWQGGKHALFELSSTVRRDVQDYILSHCAAQNKGSNELTKPTGTKFVYILQPDDDEDGEQGALCLPTIPATLESIYRSRHVKYDNTTDKRTAPAQISAKMHNVNTRRLQRSPGTTSFARMMASANEEGFPLADRELDSDDSDSSEQSVRATATQSLYAIAEEDGDADDGFVNVVDYECPKYCRDSDSSIHPDCNGRYKTGAHALNAIDSNLDFQQRFDHIHNGGDSITHYRNWRILKWDHGETMVHGESSLRSEMVVEDQLDEEQCEDGAKRLIRMIDAKYGPLTLQGQKKIEQVEMGDAKLSDESLYKISRYLEEEELDPWLSKRSSFDEHQDTASVPSMLFHGVADLDDDTAVPFVAPQINWVPSVSEDTLIKVC